MLYSVAPVTDTEHRKRGYSYSNGLIERHPAVIVFASPGGSCLTRIVAILPYREFEADFLKVVKGEFIRIDDSVMIQVCHFKLLQHFRVSL